ncbi:glycosyltransferase [Desulfuromonas acetexigens]|uniref:Glycosyltransferase family 2 protein n=1 Tax=Trichloromonas acetexigens TaxID=38815 RepID=A0A550JJG3_9BACT|nr:glycosyltransferase [Desulfuromonas acetexigens]TRO83357.1 glycosyltransferase family 2 protein [Desulfuromonas acetexigens]
MISVVLATHNGEKTLPITLDAFCQLELPEIGVEFIVVDNASNDSTSSIIKEYLEKIPLKYFYERRKGKVFAINKGLEEARGDLIVLTDDDVVPVKSWLSAFLIAANQHPEAALFLGQIRPYWLGHPPTWLKQLTDIGRSCGCTPITMPEGNVPYHLAKGANMLVRKEVFQKVTLREDLWIAGQDAAGGEDTDFAKKAYELGFGLWFTPNAKIAHIVQPREMTVRAVWKRYYRIGRSIAAVQSEPLIKPKKIFGYPAWPFLHIAKRCLIVIGNIILFKKYGAMVEIINIATTWGRYIRRSGK